MKLLRFLVAPALLLILLASSSLVFASHYWAVTSASCNAENGVVSGQGYLSNNVSSADTYALDANGAVIGQGSSNSSTVGTKTFSFHVSGVKAGDTIQVGDFQEGPWLTVACGSGPASPDGFVLRRITCDTAVYQEPAGAPVGSDAITAGQTWFVSPEPEEAADGSSWTAVWTGGFLVGYIPTSCLGEFIQV